MTPGGSAGTAAAGYRAEDEPGDEATEQLREALARTLSTWVIGAAYENSWLCADALLAGPLAPLLAKLRAVEELAATWERRAAVYDAHDDRDKVTALRQRANAIRLALDAT